LLVLRLRRAQVLPGLQTNDKSRDEVVIHHLLVQLHTRRRGKVLDDKLATSKASVTPRTLFAPKNQILRDSLVVNRAQHPISATLCRSNRKHSLYNALPEVSNTQYIHNRE